MQLIRLLIKTDEWTPTQAV